MRGRPTPGILLRQDRLLLGRVLALAAPGASARPSPRGSAEAVAAGAAGRAAIPARTQPRPAAAGRLPVPILILGLAVTSACCMRPAAGQGRSGPQRGGSGSETPGKAAPRVNLYEQARQLEAAEKRMEAARVYEQAAKQEPDQAISLLDRAGWLYFDAGAPGEAARVFAALAAREPNLVNAIEGLAVARFEAGDWPGLQQLLEQRLPQARRQEAVGLTQAGITAPAGSVDREWALGFLYTQLGRFDSRAIPHLEQVLQRQPAHREALWQLGELYRFGPRQQDAQRVWQEYVRLYPDTSEAFILRARQRAGASLADGLGEAEEGIRRFPDAALLYWEAARLCSLRREPEEAAAGMQGLIELAEGANNAQAAFGVRFELARYDVAHQRYAEAEWLYRECVRPGELGGVWVTIAQLALAQGKLADGAAAGEEAAAAYKKEPTSGAAAIRSAREWQLLALLAAGKREQAGKLATAARSEAEGAKSRAPEFDALLLWLGAEAGREGALDYRPGDERQPAFEWYVGSIAARQAPPALDEVARRSVLRAVIERYPDCTAAHYALARSLCAAREFDAALKSLEAARDTKPRWWAPHWGLAELCLRAGQISTAREELRLVCTLAPQLLRAKELLNALPERAPPPARKPP
jgi:tetratricopeptide (TPR) repeat protein